VGNGKRSLRRPKLSTKGSSAPGRRSVKLHLVGYTCILEYIYDARPINVKDCSVTILTI